MKLWLLGLVNENDLDWDCAAGFVVRAATEKEAREFAQSNGGDEAGHPWSQRRPPRPFWTDPALTTCTELTIEGEPGVVLRDFNAG